MTEQTVYIVEFGGVVSGVFSDYEKARIYAEHVSEERKQKYEYLDTNFLIKNEVVDSAWERWQDEKKRKLEATKRLRQSKLAKDLQKETF